MNKKEIIGLLLMIPFIGYISYWTGTFFVSVFSLLPWSSTGFILFVLFLVGGVISDVFDTGPPFGDS